MYEGGIRVPFVVAGPGVAHGSVSRIPVTGLDILPTIADLAGYPKALPAKLDGGSLRTVLEGRGAGQVERQRPFLIFHHAIGRRAQTGLRLDDWKIVKTWKHNRVELFDLSKDLGETRNLAAENPAKARELESLIDGFVDEVGASTEGK